MSTLVSYIQICLMATLHRHQLQKFWEHKSEETAAGSVTTGSSEATHVDGLAMIKKNGRRSVCPMVKTFQLNTIMGERTSCSREVRKVYRGEAHILPVSEKSHLILDAKLAKQNIDENTIGVFVILSRPT